MTALMALLGAIAAGGLVLAFAAIRGIEPIGWRPPKVQVRGRSDKLLTRAGLAVGAGTLMGAITGWPVGALLVAGACWALPSFVGGKAARQASLARVEAVASWAEMLRDTMAGAGGLEQSIVATAGVAPPAIGPEIRALASRLERTRLAPALRTFADELADPTADLVVAALVLAADKSPKRLGDLLGTLAASARTEVQMRMRVEAGRARTRTSVQVVTISTTVFALLLLVFNRKYLTPYDTAVGQMVLGVVGGLFATSFVWLARASKVTPGERFLRSTDRADQVPA